MICYWYTEPTYFFFAPDLPALLYYSHIPTSIIALLVGFFIFFNARHSLLNKLLFLISISFSLWILINLIAWTNIHSDFILFAWSFFGVLSSLFSVLSIYFIYVFLNKEDVTLKIKAIFFALLAPVIIFAHTDLSLSGFNLAWCDAFEYEGLGFKIYYTLIGVIAMVWILGLLIKHYRTASANFRKQILLMGIGIEFFLFSFLSANFLVTYLAGIGILPDSSLELYGMFGMTVFMVMVGILIVKFKTFNVGMIASQALLISLIILTGSQFTFITSTTNAVLTSISLVLTGVIGIMMMRSVRKEIRQKEELAQLTQELAIANDRLKDLDKLKSEFVSIASHQLRSPLTSIRGYASLLLEESYGKMPKKAIEPLTRIEDSSKLMALAIEDYLNVSRIESGNMKYSKEDFNLKDQTDHVCDDIRADALRNGLSLIFRSDIKSRGVVNGDLGKTVQILRNLINNSVKYTEKGSIKVLVRDDIVHKKIFVDIIDTGIGMSKKTQETIFEKFERADNANSVNVQGTGLGLFVALKMAKAMDGNITSFSDGDGKGSRFTLVLPLAM